MILNCGPAIYESASSNSVNYKSNNVRLGTQTIHKLLSVGEPPCELRSYQCRGGSRAAATSILDVAAALDPPLQCAHCFKSKVKAKTK